MLGILVQLVLSWLILKWYDGSGLGVLGLGPGQGRFVMAVFFTLFAAACVVSGYLIRIYYGGEVWGLNPKLNVSLVWEVIMWNLRSVLFEELIFRGALFYILWDKWGSATAMFVSSIAFGIYHWFSYEIIGQPVQMAIIFFVTGLVGLLYAYAFLRTRTLWIPIALHFGWNLTKSFVFSEGSIGKGVFVLKEQPVVTVSTWIYYLAVWNPMVMFLVLGYFLLRRKSSTIM